jgi:hypothetical protein
MGRYYYGREYKLCYTVGFIFLSVVGKIKRKNGIRPNKVSEIKERKIVLILGFIIFHSGI